MTQYFCGKGGSDSNDGTTWALRKLTLNGVSGLESLTLSAGDELIIGPGTYREDFEAGYTGSNGSEIILRGDITGKDTDGIGGQVVMTGSDYDLTAARSYGITLDSGGGIDYWIVKNIHFEFWASAAIYTISYGSDWIIEDCTFLLNMGSSSSGVRASDLNGGYIIRRCLFLGLRESDSVYFHPASETNFDATIENCLFIGGSKGIVLWNAINVAIGNCTFYMQSADGVGITVTLTGTSTVNNCVFAGVDGAALLATELGDLIEDYNTFWGNNNDRSLVATGANSETFPPLFELPLLLDGYVFPSKLLCSLSERSTLQLAGTSETSEDFFGITKPATAAKSSWGAFQQRLIEREATTVYDSSTASLKLEDAGDHQMFVPVDGSEITISVRAYREADYTGTLPTMIVRQPGQSDSSTVDTGSVSTWNLLTDTLTPSSDTDYVVVILRSLNTATSGNYDTFFDALAVA